MPATLLACNVCHQEVPRTAEFWHRQPQRSDGLSETCKVCATQRSKDWYAANLERTKAQRQDFRKKNRGLILKGKAQYRAANVDKIRASQRAKHAANPEKKRANANRYRLEHPAEVAAKKKADRLAHPETHKARSRKYYAADPAAAKARTSKWRALNPEKHRANSNNYRTRKVSAPGKTTAQDLFRLFELQSGACFYCEVNLDGTFHIDHYLPLSKGGTNEFNNLVLACPTCNTRKSASMPEAFLSRIRPVA